MSDKLWQETPVPILVNFVTSGQLFARIRAKGKLIRLPFDYRSELKDFGCPRLRLADSETSSCLLEV